MNILHQSVRGFTEKILPQCLKKWRKRLQFGFEVLSTQRIESLNANARAGVSKRKTAETKIFRVVHTRYFERLFPELLSTLTLVKPYECINVDFSNFQGRQVLMFAKQTREGRAIPLYFEFLRYPIEKGSQNLFIEAAVLSFVEYIKVPIQLVFDRGFALPYLVKFLMKHHLLFTIRIKQGKHVEYKAIDKAVHSLHRRDVTATLYGHLLRIVRSPPHQAPQPWYLVTNDTSSYRQIIARYYYRFEIEEYFKDAKHLQKVSHLCHLSDQAFRILLWFMILAAWLCSLITPIIIAWKSLLRSLPSHHRISLLHFWLEELFRHRYRPVFPAL